MLNRFMKSSLSSVYLALLIEVISLFLFLALLEDFSHSLSIHNTPISIEDSLPPVQPKIETPVDKPTIKPKEIIKKSKSNEPPIEKVKESTLDSKPAPSEEASPLTAANSFSQPPSSAPSVQAVTQQTITPSDEYRAQIQAAVQAAYYYPMAAQEMGLHGRIRVQFSLKNTTPSEITIITSSNFKIIDTAAIKAIQTALYPNPPADLKDKSFTYTIWVEFRPSS